MAEDLIRRFGPAKATVVNAARDVGSKPRAANRHRSKK
jgi:hypothetical protein